ncbi:MAG: hypothetical protein AAFX99_00175 [Myxococcota bacterium]
MKKCFGVVWVMGLSIAAVGCLDEEEGFPLVEQPYDDATMCGSTTCEDHSEPDETATLVGATEEMPVPNDVDVVVSVCSTELNWSLNGVHVSGQLTTNGTNRSSLSPVGTLNHRGDGRLVFTDTQTGIRYEAPLEVEGDIETYDTTLFAGRYDVTLEYVNEEQDCYWGCPLALLGREMRLAHTQTLDFDVRLAPLNGLLTLDGERIPEETYDNIGLVYFIERETGIEFSAPVTEDATFQIALVEGFDYEAYWVVGSRWYPSTGLDGMSGVASLGAFTGGPEQMEFNAETVEVSGVLTVAGEVMPDDGLLDGRPRGRLYFSRSDLGDMDRWSRIRSAVSLGEQGQATFDIRLFKGEYTALFQASEADEQDALPPLMQTTACGGEGMTDCVFSDPALHHTIRLDVHMATSDEEAIIHGRLELEGEVSPAIDERDVPYAGHITFIDRNGGYHQTSISPEGLFAVHLDPAATYSVVLHGNAPRGVTTLAKEFVAEPNADVTFRARVVRLQGEVRVNGSTMHDNGADHFDSRGTLELIGPIDPELPPYVLGQIDIDLGRQGAARFETMVLAGKYHARVSTVHQGRAIDEYSQDVLPRGVGEIGVMDIEEPMDEVNVDLNVKRVHGFITSGHTTTTTNPNHRPMLRLTPEDGLGFPVWTALSPEGRFELWLFEGNYIAELGLRNERGWDSDTSEAPFGRTYLGEFCVD